MSNSTSQLMPTFARLRRARFWPLLWLVPIGILAGMVGDALMNAINRWISPLYFSWFLFRNFRLSDSWLLHALNERRASIVFSVVFSVVYTFVVVVVSRANCPLRVALRGLFRLVFLIYLTGFLFGLNAVILVRFLSDEWQQENGFPASVIYGMPIDSAKFTYVWGSVHGIEYGGIIAVIVGCIWFSFDWRKFQRELQT